MKTRDQIFISYAHQDKAYLDELLIHLKPLIREGSLQLWVDRQLQPGDRWLDDILDALERAKVAVFLVSPHFMASDFIQREELPVLLTAANRAEVRMFVIPLQAAVTDHSPLTRFQWVRGPNSPLALLSKAKRQAAWVDIVGQLKKAYEAK